MKVFVIGAGQVGTTIVESLHETHQLTVVDIDGDRLTPLSHRFDVRTSTGSGASRRTLQEAGIADADLLIACTSRDETNIVAAMLARRLAPKAKTIVRTANVEYLQVWHERQLDVDFIVCSELETALAVSRLIGLPAARQTDVFADGQVQIVEFEVEADARARGDVIGKPLREANLPDGARVASIIRAGKMLPPFGRESIEVGDRVIKRSTNTMTPRRERSSTAVLFRRIGETNSGWAVWTSRWRCSRTIASRSSMSHAGQRVGCVGRVRSERSPLP